MKPLIAVCLVSLALATGSGCASNPPPKTVPVDAVQLATDIAKVLVSLSRAIEAAADDGRITVPQAKEFLAPIRAALVTLRDTPDGGFAVALAAVNQTERLISPGIRPRLQPYIDIARSALEVFRGRP
jgi:hypothetical protein